MWDVARVGVLMLSLSSAGIDLDVKIWRRQILTSKVDPRTERVNYL